MQRIPAYQLPAARLGGPADRWTFEARTTALLVHDMQEYFVGAFDATLRETLVANVARATEWARANGIPVVYSAQPGSMSTAERGLLADFWGAGMDRTESEVSIVAEVKPAAEDLVVTKWRYSAFVGNGLGWALRRRGIRQLAIVGVYASVGIMATALDAFNNDIQPFVISDCVADFDAAGHSAAMEYVARYCGRVLTLGELSTDG